MRNLFLILTFLTLAVSAQGQWRESVITQYAWTDTVTNAKDTASRFIASTENDLNNRVGAYRITVYAMDSTLELSSDASFPSNKTIRIVAGASWNSPSPYSSGFFRNWYIRKRSTHGGTCNYLMVIEETQ